MKTFSEKCFLCRKNIIHLNCSKPICETSCPSSRKTIGVVLEHLASISKIQIHIRKDEKLCEECFLKITDYDGLLVTLVKKQNALVDLVEKSLSDCDEINETCNSELEHSEEFNFSDTDSISDIAIEDIEFGELHQSTKNADAAAAFLCKKRLLQCKLCAMRFQSKSKLWCHLSNAHKKFSCTSCDYSHQNEEYVKLHMNLHEGKTENQCRYCDKVFSTKISTLRHMEVHLDNKKYQCDKCGLCFSQTTIMYNHRLQHEAEEEPLHCEICSQLFKTKRTYRHHMITHKADRPRHACEFCGKTFTEKYTLKVHKRTYHPINPVLNKSEGKVMCSKDEMTNDGLTEDLVEEVDGTLQVEPFAQCIHCNRNFNSKELLTTHVAKEHTSIPNITMENGTEIVANEEKTTCDICGITFRCQSNLNYHKLHMHLSSTV